MYTYENVSADRGLALALGWGGRPFFLADSILTYGKTMTYIRINAPQGKTAATAQFIIESK